MESHIAASDDVLIDSLNFRPGKSGSFVSESRSVRFPCESANRFSPTSQRLMRFRLTSSHFLDPLSVRFSFDVREIGGSTAITFLSPKPMALFQRARIIAGSTIIDDVDYVGRTVTMLERLKPPGRAMNEVIMGPGAASDSTLAIASGTLDTILASDARTMCTDLSFMGLFRNTSGSQRDSWDRSLSSSSLIPTLRIARVDLQIGLSRTPLSMQTRRS